MSRHAHRRVVFVGLARAVGKRAVEAGSQIERGFDIAARQSQPQLNGLVGRDRLAVPARHLGAATLRIHRGGTRYDVVVDAVFRIRRLRRAGEHPREVRVVVAEQQLRRAAAALTRFEQPSADAFLLGDRTCTAVDRVDRRAHRVQIPRPSIAEPQRRQHVQFRRIRSRVADADAHAHVVRRRFRVVDLDLPVTVRVERAGMFQVELALRAVAPRILFAQTRIRELGLRIVIAPLQPRRGRRGVDIPPVLLRVFAVISFGAGQTEDAFLQKRIAAVPQRQRKTHSLFEIADSGETVFVPPVSPRARVVMRKVIPGIAVGAVILSHGAPRTLAHVRTDRFPLAGLPVRRRRQAFVFGGARFRCHARPPSREPATRTTTVRAATRYVGVLSVGASFHELMSCGDASAVSTQRRQPV